MKYKELEGIGLTKSEILVYTSLLKLGQSKTGEIVKEAKIASGKIYEILHKLIEKGLVGYIVKNNVKHFSSTNPDKLKEYIVKRRREIEAQEKKVEALIPELKSLKKNEDEYTAEVYTGLRAVQDVILNSAKSMKKESEYLSMGVSGARSKGISILWEQFVTIISRKNAVAKILVSNVSKESLKDLKILQKRFHKSYYRYLPGFYLAPIMVIEDKTYIVNWDTPSILVITNKIVAEQFRFFFNSMWKIAKIKP